LIFNSVVFSWTIGNTFNKEVILARNNYSYQKHQRELAKKKKKEEKMQHKLNKNNMQSKDEPEQIPDEVVDIKQWRWTKYQRRHDMGYKDDRGFDRRPREMFKATCADCKKECEVPFKPREDRPVYCKECFAKRKDSGR
jgi:CxxC-x17-CxxC domain-containing protein